MTTAADSLGRILELGQQQDIANELALHAGGIVVSRNGNEFTIDRANRRACEIFGYMDGELVGKNVNDLLCEEFREPHQALLEGWDGNKLLIRSFKQLAIKQDGERIHVSVFVAPHSTNSGKIFAIVFSGPVVS